MNPHLPTAQQSSGVGKALATLVVVILAVVACWVVTALLLMWLVPIATAGAVALGFWQATAIAGLISLAKIWFTDVKKK